MKKLLIMLLMVCSLVGVVRAREDLARNFVTPPDSARIWVYWFWLNGNITRGGITADLEAMKRAGVGGVLIMEVDQGSPVGPVAFMSERWRELFKHMVAEAHRLGLEVNMNNDAGWNGSGGPWVPLDQAMQVIVTSETQVQGGRKFEGELPKPRANAGFYRDIAVLAFPTPADPTNLAYRITNLKGKGMSYDWQCGSLDVGADVPAESVISKSKIVDLTAKMDASGKLRWDPPTQGFQLRQGSGGQAGVASSPQEWTVVRFGHTFTGKEVHPAPKTGTGPECDKLSKEAIEAHYDAMIGKLAKEVGPLAGKTLVSTHVDSCEHGAQNWTPTMREEFKRLRGYDMMPFLPVMTGRIVDSVDISERFLRDVRQTVSDLFVENYIGHLRKLANRDSLRLSMESYRNPANDLDVANQVDEPMCEFWSDETDIFWCVKAMASTAHVNGRPIVGAEAFTCGDGERWRAHPATLKAVGDRAFCDGVNRFVVHRYAMQPWVEDRKPGMTMGPYGVHYERSTTWWEDSIAWHQYVARCQYMLRQGRFVADALWLQPEEPMMRLWDKLDVPGYDYDAISPQAFLKNAGVKGGMLELPSGMNYRLLILPKGESMTPKMLDKIKDLVEAGATFVGMPPVKASGLSGYPQSDGKIAETAKALWGSSAPGPAGERKVGKGRVVWGKPVPEVLATIGVVPDFASSRPLRHIHRDLDGTDVYFVANPDPFSAEAVCTFRVSGKTPEVWFPDTGRIQPISVFEETNGCTRIPLRFEPIGSMFIVFKQGSAKASERIVSVKRDGQELVKMSETDAKSAAGAVSQLLPLDLVNREISQNGTYEIKTADGKSRQVAVTDLPAPLEIKGPWELKFAPGWGAPEKIVLDDLVSWSKHSDSGVKYFSGSATYRKLFDLPAEVRSQKSEVVKSDLRPLISDLSSRVYLDLGKVAIMAEVKLNGKNLGILWKAPYRVDITDAVKAGENVLEIRVVNLPINRMIGDEFLPEDSERNKNGTLRKWPQWLEEGKPSPTGRFTFTSWRLWKKDEPLQESGLLGPVTVRTALSAIRGEISRAGEADAGSSSPRIVNIINFIRQCEPRIEWITKDVLYETVVEQINIMKKYQLKGTFLLQYDALVDVRYQKLLKELPSDMFEIGAWWEIPQPLVENSGYQWRGRYPWDWHADVGFATGYSPPEREKLTDTYMADFKKIFGYYPKSVGSWFIDAHTLQYMHDRYGIVASCNCKDQVGTDGYTLWGGYWNQGYYPSKKNAYMPAQNAENQIPVPIFRMLGSDPIHQYDSGLGGNHQRVVSLEPVYEGGGGNADWCQWYFDAFVDGAAMGYAYTQVGQENSFAWKRMAKGFNIQMPMIARLLKEGKVEVKTLGETGKWFKDKYKVTPPTSVTVLSDHSKMNQKTVWFNSRFYRANLLWDQGTMRFRDIHLFDETVASDYLTKRGTSSQCFYYTLPVVDGFNWSTSQTVAGLRFKSAGGVEIKGGTPTVDDRTAGELTVRWPIESPKGEMLMTFTETSVSVSAVGGVKDHWFLELSNDKKAVLPFRKIDRKKLSCEFRNAPYSIAALHGVFTSDPGSGLRIIPEDNRVVLDCSSR